LVLRRPGSRYRRLLQPMFIVLSLSNMTIL
jgi:hypothetical protein